ncbi:MAG: bacteriohemerythrin [Gammaproteobacteria bacterium]|nr:bacteriohemerythrin [Gammaproteobacteria bacterium]MCP5298534.1 bacteriohemerythrin [Chromatiaceae bacterium]
MPSVEWNPGFEIGIAVIDGQHRRIVDYINTLHDLGPTADRRHVAHVIDDLVDYTYSHFAFEEALMEEAGYVHLAVHCKTHEAFRQRLDDLQGRFNDGDDIAGELGKMLVTWLLRHIASDDISYAPVVRERMPGITQKNDGSWLKQAIGRFFGT